MIKKVIDVVGYLSAFVLSLLIILVVYDATVRYIFSGGSIALQELEWHLFDFIILFGIAYALKEGAHVRVDILYGNFSHKSKTLISIISSLFFILPFSLLIIYISIDFVSMSFVQQEASSNPGGLEYRYIVKSLLPLSFVFVSLQTLQDAKENFLLWRTL